jgi:hypothetical protein
LFANRTLSLDVEKYQDIHPFIGKGIFNINDRTYEGSFKNGKLSGFVKETNVLTGERWEGSWENNLKVGLFKYTDANGKQWN